MELFDSYSTRENLTGISCFQIINEVRCRWAVIKMGRFDMALLR